MKNSAEGDDGLPAETFQAQNIQRMRNFNYVARQCPTSFQLPQNHMQDILVQHHKQHKTME